MTVAKIVELSSESTRSFDNAIHQGIERAVRTLEGVSGVWVKGQEVLLTNGRISGYRVRLKVTFVLDEGRPRGDGEGRGRSRRSSRKGK
jgi:flavin-binding protein dodecin